jgi:hypothetical protein
MLDMVIPTDVDFQTPTRGEDKTILSPGHGSPGTDPAYTNRLQNSDLYGNVSKVKQLPMINSKVQWNGKRSTFDEMKRLIEGHFEGYGAAYLVSRKFIKIYMEHGNKVLCFFPWICIRVDDLEKQNGTLYGSLKQICRKGAGLAVLRKHEARRDGMKTWIEFLNWYDNMGSNDVMTIYYDEVIS